MRIDGMDHIVRRVSDLSGRERRAYARLFKLADRAKRAFHAASPGDPGFPEACDRLLACYRNAARLFLPSVAPAWLDRLPDGQLLRLMGAISAANRPQQEGK